MAKTNGTYPFEIHDVDPEQAKQLKISFGVKENSIYNCGTSRFGPTGYMFPRKLEIIGREIYNMEIRPTDIFVATFPKSGTTWTQELVWLIGNNFDFEKANAIPLTARFPYIEAAMLLNTETVANALMNEEMITKSLEDAIPSIEELSRMSSPRFFKTHLPFSLLPPKLLDTCKVVYVAREPRDVAVSWYHYKKFTRMYPEDGDFKTYWHLFKNDLVIYTPYFEHLKEAWRMRNHPNMVFLFYEELSKDLPECAQRVAKLLNKEITEEQLQKLCEHLKFDNFKNNKSVNLDEIKQFGLLTQDGSFIRKGKVGGWRKYFDEEMTQQAEQWIEENLRDTDLRFPQ